MPGEARRSPEKFPRGTCPLCRHDVAITRDGSRTHKHPCADPNRDDPFYDDYSGDGGEYRYLAVVEMDSGYIIKGEFTRHARDEYLLAQERRRYFSAARRLVAGGLGPLRIERPSKTAGIDMAYPERDGSGMWVPLLVWVAKDDVTREDDSADTAPRH